jgi:hypothetical protein
MHVLRLEKIVAVLQYVYSFLIVAHVVSVSSNYSTYWKCDIIVLNVHVPTEDKNDDKDSFYKELEHVFDQLPKYHIKILWYFNAEVAREDTFKPTIRNESLHLISNDNWIRVINFATSKNLTVKITRLLQSQDS